MTQTMGPQGAVNVSVATASPVLLPSQYGQPTLVREQQSVQWEFNPSLDGYYRFDALLTRMVSRAPLPLGQILVHRVRMWRNNSFQTGLQTDSPGPVGRDEGLVWFIDADATWKVQVTSWAKEVATGETFDVDVWAVLRISDSYQETIQLPERDCLVVWDDSKDLNEGDVRIGTGVGLPGGADISILDVEMNLFQGGYSWTRAFGDPLDSPVGYANAVNWAWDFARGRSVSGLDSPQWDADYGEVSSEFSGEPSAPPDLGEGPPERSNGSQAGINNHLGFILEWTTQPLILLPASAGYTTYARAFNVPHNRLLQEAGPLGDGREFTELAAGGWLELEDYFTIDLPLHTYPTWGVAEILEIGFRPDETPATSFSFTPDATHTIDDQCTALWLTSEPEQYADGVSPAWGPYLNEGGVLAVSNRQKPEDWVGDESTLSVLAIYDGGDPGTTGADGWSEISVKDAGDAYYLWVLPLELWQDVAPDGAQDPDVNGARAHFRGNPRFSLKLRVLPAPFTGHFTPPLEPADPPYPDIVGEAGPPRRTFWPR